MRPPCTGLKLFVASAAMLICCATASAHHSGVHTHQAASPDAISIPSLSHGQMTVIAANRSAILDLASRMPHTDSTLRRLTAFINLQFSACMWGLMPGSLSDEDSPFNECTHAYLAATQALLLHLQAMAAAQDAAPLRNTVRDLVAKVQREMIVNRTSLVLCRYSDEPFNTSERIAPHWERTLFHTPSLLTLASTGLLCFGAIWGIVRMTRSRPADTHFQPTML